MEGMQHKALLTEKVGKLRNLVGDDDEAGSLTTAGIC